MFDFAPAPLIITASKIRTRPVIVQEDQIATSLSVAQRPPGQRLGGINLTQISVCQFPQLSPVARIRASSLERVRPACTGSARVEPVQPGDYLSRSRSDSVRRQTSPLAAVPKPFSRLPNNPISTNNPFQLSRLFAVAFTALLAASSSRPAGAAEKQPKWLTPSAFGPTATRVYSTDSAKERIVDE
ncbi:unnamed protein product [Protopolystoma xenopodis]|uniref:Uncharacterized protein n=1 Tax=Protopolystoma xenopodis TaxID=117903 RepID=A0A3S5AA08_9PLAT|nr:unnamed protein product [Protopolystoma xenopodis]